MTHALKIHAIVSGKTLTLRDLDAFEGKRVEVTVREEEPTRPMRRFGSMAGAIQVAEDFDEPLPDELEQGFEGGAK